MNSCDKNVGHVSLKVASIRGTRVSGTCLSDSLTDSMEESAAASFLKLEAKIRMHRVVKDGTCVLGSCLIDQAVDDGAFARVLAVGSSSSCSESFGAAVFCRFR